MDPVSRSPHTLSSIDAELRGLAQQIDSMGALVLAQITAVLDAIRHTDTSQFDAVIADDAKVDACQGKIEEQLLSLLAQIQPVAGDLRWVLSGQRVALELERCGDHCKRISKQLRKIHEPLSAELSSRLQWFGGQARVLLQRALESYRQADASVTRQAWDDDAELDRVYHGFLSELLARMREDSSWVDVGVRLVGVAKSLERIGDHATNIAEEARFVASGEVLTARRSV